MGKSCKNEISRRTGHDLKTVKKRVNQVNINNSNFNKSIIEDTALLRNIYIKKMNKLQSEFMVIPKNNCLQIENTRLQIGDNTKTLQLWIPELTLPSIIQMEEIAAETLLKKSDNGEIYVPNFSLNSLPSNIKNHFLKTPNINTNRELMVLSSNIINRFFNNSNVLTHGDLIILSSFLHVSLYNGIKEIYLSTHDLHTSIEQGFFELTKTKELSKVMKEICKFANFENNQIKSFFYITKEFILFLEKKFQKSSMKIENRDFSLLDGNISR